tara:strand:- start:1020 stop:2408 length:1389 start_codon:yes stop_codon:yes gene_type:complete
MIYAQKSLQIALQLHNWGDAAYTASSIADIYWNNGEYQKAMSTYHKALEYAPPGMPVSFYFTSYTNMGSIYIDWGEKLDSAKHFFDEAYLLSKELNENDVEYQMHAEANMFKYYFDAGDYAKAKYYLDRAYDFIPRLNSPYLTSFFYQYYSDYYAAVDQMDSAFSYLQKHYHLRDSINGFELKQNRQEMEAKYETAKKEKHIAQLQNRQKIDKVRKQILLTIVIFTAVLFLITFVFFLVNRKKSRKLAEQNEIIQRSYNEIENLIRESHHRIKNNLQVVSSLLKMQSKNVKSEEARASLLEAFNRVKTIAVLHQKLQGSQTFTVIQLREFINQLTDSIRGSITANNDDITIYTDIDELEVSTDQSISLGLIINELLTNSLKYAFEDGRGSIHIDLHEQDKFLNLLIVDSGKGFPEQFNPLETSSLGFKIINSLVTKLNGQISVSSEKGARVNISFPYKQEAA